MKICNNTCFVLPSYALKRVRLPLRLDLAHFSTFINKPPQRHHLAPPLPNLSNKKDPIAFANALTFASNAKLPFLGNQIHAQIIKSGFSMDIFSLNNLLVMYSKCEVLRSALKLFGEITERNLVSWTSIISGSIRNHEFEMGLEIYVEMARSGFCPNEFTLASVLSACAAVEAIKFGSSLHSIALKIGMDVNSFVGSSLLYMYAKCGIVETAEQVFKHISYRDVACWNAMVEGYALNGCGYDALRIVSFMHWKGLLSDQFTFTSVLKGCSTSSDLNYGRQIHGLVIRSEVEFSTMVMNSLSGMYLRTGLKDYALKVFGKTQQKDIVSWNTVMATFAQEEDEREVVDLFYRMLSTGFKPSQITFSIISRLCGAKDDLALGLQFFCFAYNLGFVNDAVVVNSLIDMFAKCGVIEDAYSVFINLPTRNTVTWNEMIGGYNLNGHSVEAIQLFCCLHELGIKADEFTYSSVLTACFGTQHQKIGEQVHACAIKSGLVSSCFVGSSLVNAYARFGLVGDSFKIFQEIGVPDLVSWAAMVSVFSKRGFSQEALSLLNCLRYAGETPDEFILGSALNACANIAAFNQSKCIHSHIIKAGLERHLCMRSAVIDTYAKCGDIDSSNKVFGQLKKDDDPILVNTMITAYAHHGLVKEAIELFEKMKSACIEPSHATFVAVISACGHFGLVEQGQRLFDSIISDHGMYPSMDNYACLVDLHARNGHLDKAKEVIEHMPFEPWPAVWRSLLSGCRIHGNREMGTLAAERILQLQPNNDAAHVLLSKVYAEEGSWEDAVKVRKRMLERGLRKSPGYSCIEMSVAL